MEEEDEAEVGGYELSFVDPIDKDLECPVCFLVIKRPLLTPCGHLLCTTCADQLTSDDEMKCPMDNTTFPRREAVLDRFHERKILALRVKCSHDTDGCNWNGELRLLEDHLGRKGGCQFVDFECQFSFAGCEELLHRNDIEVHEQEHMANHLELLKATFEEMKTENSRLKKEVTTLRTKVNSLESETSRMAAIRLAPETFTVVWTIENWTATLATAQTDQDYSILSRPYYISQPGYKVCLQAYPNGFQAGQSTHLSLFLKIMKGRHDGVLTWPYPLMYTITVLDQQPGGKNVRHSQDPPISSPGAANSFRKPRSEANVGWGWHEFISHEELKTRSYTKDDSIQVKLDIHLV